jgi:Peptidase family C25/PKD domain
MKKTLLLMIIGMLFLAELGAIALPNVEIKQENRKLSFSQLSVVDEGKSITLDLDGSNSVMLEKDHYMVPTHIETFTFPFGTEIQSVKVTSKNIHHQTLTKKLMIAPEPVLMGQTVRGKSNKINVDPIATNVWYEYDVGVGINRNERCVFVKVQTFPVQYDPSENTIEWAETIEIDINYKEPEQNIISFDEEYTFIVLAPSEYSDELQELVTHKISRGILTKFVTLDEIYGGAYFPVQGRDNQERIKYFIKKAIEKWGTNYVLLVGGSEIFPTRKTHIYIQGDSETFVSDLYYADIYNETGGFSSWDTNNNDVFGEYDWGSSELTDEVDLYPDAYLGRLACINTNEVIVIVNKIIIYETNKAYMQEWFTNLVVCGGDSFTSVNGDGSGINEGEVVNEAIIDIMDGFTPERLWASNGNLSGANGAARISAAINKGCGFVDFSGHGNTDRWKTHPHNSSYVWLPTPSGSYDNMHVAGLSNGEKLPIVVIGACSVGKFNSDPDCLGWAFVSNPNGGSIGSFGLTGLGWAHMGKFATEGLIEKMVLNTFYAYKNESAKTFGEMWSRAIASYIFPSMENIDFKTIEEWQAFGDPTLAIAEESHQPVKPGAPNGATSGIANKEYTYIASTTDSDGDKLYYRFDWGDNSFSGWIGPYPSGKNATASHNWEEKGKYEIRVKAKDEHGAQSEWSDPLPVSMPRSKLTNMPFLRFLEKHPYMFPLLRYALGE